ncbi:MAG TPA: metalloregulator ArsR/SmtB family transcription factor [Lacipirellulaceae bacterium]|nr:metalloregulator ArsR/SmtB family transcription factor [Lacipirellulaceae bacterium]
MNATSLSCVDLAFRAVADPTRLRILNLLLRGELCVCDIVDALGVLQPLASRHLGVLRRAGLVQSRKEGLWRHYRLAEPTSEFHRRLLDCLAHCQDAAPHLVRDGKKLGRRCC